jgi:hypothetical protein
MTQSTEWLTLGDTGRAHFDILVEDPPDADEPRYRLDELPKEKQQIEESDRAKRP